MGDVVGQIPQNRIVLEQVSECFCVGNVVHRHKLNIFVVERRADDVASDATEPVNADPNGHSSSAGMVIPCGAVFRTEFRPCCELEML